MGKRGNSNDNYKGKCLEFHAIIIGTPEQKVFNFIENPKPNEMI